MFHSLGSKSATCLLAAACKYFKKSFIQVMLYFNVWMIKKSFWLNNSSTTYYMQTKKPLRFYFQGHYTDTYNVAFLLEHQDARARAIHGMSKLQTALWFRSTCPTTKHWKECPTKQPKSNFILLQMTIPISGRPNMRHGMIVGELFPCKKFWWKHLSIHDPFLHLACLFCLATIMRRLYSPQRKKLYEESIFLKIKYCFVSPLMLWNMNERSD